MNKLCVLGESQFTRAVRSKAAKLGIKCVDDPTGVPVIVDTETYDEAIWLSEWQDVDCICHLGVSSCAEAVLETLGDVAGQHVAVIGRGHAVQGLAESLLARGATITVCHSRTRDVRSAVAAADVLVVAAPVEPWPVECRVVDVAGTFGGERVFARTTDIMLRRVLEV